MLDKFIRDEEGATIVEYAAIVCILATLMVAVSFAGLCMYILLQIALSF